ncbi:MAG TPA: RNA polymerase sigma factor [Phycisphaerae bacterium]|jgi:RNA polymerase sigma-70 factor (subfamily 1)
MDQPQAEPGILDRAVGGDRDALTLLLTDHHPRLRDYLQRKIPLALAGTVDAEDIAQESYIQVFRHIQEFEPRGEDAFYRWLATIAVRRLRNAVKKQRAVKRGAGKLGANPARPGVEDSMVGLLDLVVAPGQTPSHFAARHEALAAMQAALAELPEECRQAVWLVYIEGCSIAAAAAEMHRTESAVQNLCYKSKQRLRELLGSRSRFLSSSG